MGLLSRKCLGQVEVIARAWPKQGASTPSIWLLDSQESHWLYETIMSFLERSRFIASWTALTSEYCFV